MSSARHRLSLRFACLVLVVSLAGGCATGTNPRDPLEPFNRGVYQFNEAVDKALLKPVAQAYRAVLPQFVRSGVSNFFSNINDVVVAFNNLLQGKFTTAVSDFSRIVINSSIGLLGLIDVASDAGIEKHDEDFGQTLAVWGMGDGPFIMLPFFGPSNGRDVVGRVGDFFTDPVTYVDPARPRNQLWIARVVNRRAELLDASTILQTAALDPYEFVRDAYLQRRRNLIYDGAPPPEIEPLEPAKGEKGTSRKSTYTASLDEAVGTLSLPVPPTFAPTLSALPHEAAEFVPPTRVARRLAAAYQTNTSAPAIASGVSSPAAARAEVAPQAKAPLGANADEPANEASFLQRLWRYLVEGGTAPRQTLHGS